MSVRVRLPGSGSSLTPGASSTAYGLATSPSGGTPLAQIVSPPPGTYLCTVQAYLTGTVTGTDADNLQLTVNGVQKAQLLVPPTAAGPNPNVPDQVQVVVTTGNIAVSAIVAGGAACQYHVSLTATRVA